MRWDARFTDRSPVFGPLLPLSGWLQVHTRWPAVDDLNRLVERQTANRDAAIATHAGKPLYFAEPSKIIGKQVCGHYENGIYAAGQVPTRSENWHDFFNALVWITFPYAKAALNRIHYHVLNKALPATQPRPDKKRGARRDAATLFDESGVIVLSSKPELVALLRRHDWKTVFWRARKSVQVAMRFIVFGHALYEKALNPYVGMTGKGVFITVDDAFLQRPLVRQLPVIDRRLAGFLLRQLASNADLSPIPVLGYPGWFAANAQERFYDNRQYFRPYVGKK